MNIATFLISAIIVGLLFLAVRHIKKHGSCANCEQCRSRTGAGGSRSGGPGNGGHCCGAVPEKKEADQEDCSGHCLVCSGCHSRKQ